MNGATPHPHAAPGMSDLASSGLASPESAESGFRSGWRGTFLRARIRAALVHLLVSAVIAGGVLLLVYGFWYQQALAAVAGVGTILLLLLAVDVSLGPIMTLMVFDRRKKSLPWDMTVIALLQIAGLVYGLYAVEAGRPHYLVFVKDRIEAVSRADLQAEDIEAAAGNPVARISWLGPVWAAATSATDEKSRQDALFEAALGGRDLQHFPQRYELLANQQPQMLARLESIDSLRKLNPDDGAMLDAALKKAGLSDGQAGYLPLKGEERDAAVLMARADGRVLALLPLSPWK